MDRETARLVLLIVKEFVDHWGRYPTAEELAARLPLM